MIDAYTIIKNTLNEIKNDKLLIFGNMPDYLSSNNLEACRLMKSHNLINIVNEKMNFPLTSAKISQKGIDILKKYPDIESYFKEFESQELLKETRLMTLDNLNIDSAREAIKNYKSTRNIAIFGIIVAIASMLSQIFYK